jgi:hypothetical protein
MTTQPAVPTKQELIEALRTQGDASVAKLRAVPPDQWEQGRYENGWNARQILAHVASIEWAYPRLFDLAKAADAPPSSAAPAPKTDATPAPAARTEGGGAVRAGPETPVILSYNERQVAKRADASIDELIAEFEKNRAATIAAVESAPDELFSRVITSAGGINGPLAAVINATAVLHVGMHIADIAGEPWSGTRV